MDHSEVENLIQRLSVNQTISSEAALEELLSVDRQQLIYVLTKLLASDDIELRMWELSCFVIIKLDLALGIRLLLPFLSSTNIDKRWYVTGLLGRYGNNEVVEPLINLLEHEPIPEVRNLAAFSLGKLGDKRALKILQFIKEHDDSKDYEGRSIADTARQAIESILKIISHN
ncbi:MAG: HEAT repeat domain-containing protein [Anaerolineae bacterium]|nr:MAG: HEAT repeat domain-containing protein [Anaerolineae bacterium]